jgi:hypothetical protein
LFKNRPIVKCKNKSFTKILKLLNINNNKSKDVEDAPFSSDIQYILISFLFLTKFAI